MACICTSVTVTYYVGGPGAGKAKYCSKLAEKYPDFVCISPATQIREGGDSAAQEQMNRGEMLDTVRY